MMNIPQEDERLLRELCEQHSVSVGKVIKLLEAIQEFEFKERRVGVYDALKEILRSKN